MSIKISGYKAWRERRSWTGLEWFARRANAASRAERRARMEWSLWLILAAWRERGVEVFWGLRREVPTNACSMRERRREREERVWRARDSGVWRDCIFETASIGGGDSFKLQFGQLGKWSDVCVGSLA